MPNYIRVKQLNKPELSGFLLETLNENLENAVYVTGDQIINGQKTFNGNLSITGSNVANVTNGATLQLSGYRVITTNETGGIYRR